MVNVCQFDGLGKSWSSKTTLPVPGELVCPEEQFFFALSSAKMFFVLLLTILSTCRCGESEVSTVIHVDSVNGNDSQCGNLHYQRKPPCATLEKANELLQVYGNDVSVEILSNVTLHAVFKVINATNIQIKGKCAKDMICVNCKDENAAFLINDVHNFSFSNLAVVNCTAKSPKVYAHRFALLVQATSKITIFNTLFMNCTSTALVLSNNKGEVKLDGNSFIYNLQFVGRSYHYPKTSHPAALSIEQNIHDSKSIVHYTITNSLFDHNDSPHSKTVSDYDTADEAESFRKNGYGGAIFIELGRNTNGSSIIVQNTNFSYNSGERGGAVYVYFRQNASNNSVKIVQSRFYRNNAHTCGAGISAGFFNSPSLMNVVVITECFFIENTALIAAGMRIYSMYSKQKVSRSVIVTDSTWKGNRAILSSAVDIIPIYRDFENEGYLPVPEFTNCTFTDNINNNQPHRHKQQYYTDSGVFSITKFKVSFGEKMTFTNNKFSALLLLSGTAEFLSETDALFMNNSGYYGGAIAMYGFSTIVFNPYSFFNFSKNYAIISGGGIFHQPIDRHAFLKGDVNCFLKSRLPKDLSLLNTIQVVFEDNLAEVGGSSIYAETVDGCYFRCYSKHVKYLNRSGDGFVQCVGDFTFDKDSIQHPAVTTSGQKFKFYENSTTSQSLKVIPGDKLNLSFDVIDRFNKTIQPLISIRKVNKTAHIEVSNPYSLTSTVYPLGKCDATSTFTLSVLSLNTIAFDFNMILLPCPPGYHNKDGRTCTCATGKNGYTFIINCDDAIFSASYGEDLWVGYIPEDSSYHTHLYFAPCFGPVCNGSNHNLPKFQQNLADLVCSPHRKGIMCGKCSDNHSTYYHSRKFTCGPNRHCYFGSLYYILSELIPMVIFFVIVITFDISFTTGKLTGFIFFTQYINELTVHTHKLFSYLRTPYRIFYGLFNFEFFNIEELSFCLWQGAQIQDVLAIRYVTIVMALALVLIFIAVMNNNQCSKLCNIRRRISTKISVIHGLASFLVICYAQCTKTSFYILKYSIPVGYKGVHEHYFSYYGGLPYFHKEHLIYAVPALLSLVFVTILPPLVLLLYPFSLQLLSLCGLSEHWLVNKTLRLIGISKLVPFIDCFQGYYKDKLRFFAGLYFVYRVAVLLAFSFSSTSFGFSLSSGIILTLILGIHSTFQPYKKNIHNIIDSLLFLNLAVINICAVLIKNAIRHEITSSYGLFVLVTGVIQLVLLYLPMLIILSLIGRIIISRIRRKEADFIPVDDILDDMQDTNPGTINSRRSYGSINVTCQDTY